MDTVIQRQFDELRIVRTQTSSPLSAPRPSPAESARWPFLLVYALRGATRFTHGTTGYALDTGDIVLVANDAASLLVSGEDAAALVVLVPDGAVGPYRSAFASAAGRISSAREGSPRLVGHLLDGLAGNLAELTPAMPSRLARHIVGFVAMVCAEAEGPGSENDRILRAAKDYIEGHLGEMDLGPERIARAHNVSIRTLHRLFEREQSTVAGWIRSRRLDHCRSELADAAHDHESVSAIGARWGFWDAAHFSRLFKTRYGLSPRAYRTERLRRRAMEPVSA